MKKSDFFLLFAMTCIAGKSLAQTVVPCGADEMHQKYLQQNPQIAAYEKQLEKDISNLIANHETGRFERKTASTHAWDDWYDIPVVVHVMHNYGAELLNDNAIYDLITEMNRFYSLQQDTTSVITPFKKYVGNPKIRFHLATKDPFGQPTKGITHRFTYLASGGDDNVKMDLWNPANYYNIWFENRIGMAVPGGEVLAYANFPSSAAAYPFNDGVICGYQFIADGGTGGSTIDHETGHFFNLYHTWNSSGQPCGMACGDDEVDDTPPTVGHPSNFPLYDTTCAINYFKQNTDMNGNDSLVNYPDTTNVQNTMDYSATTCMFTKGQVERMRGALNSDIGHRDSLWSDYNLALTGALVTNDLPPVTDFTVKSVSGGNINYFTCPGTNVRFISACWNDTVTNIDWSFSTASGPALQTATAAQNPGQVTAGTSAASSVTNSFSNGGWVSFTLAATGNHTGTTTTTYPRAVFVSDVNATQAGGYYMEFNNSDTAKWPMFNYYNNEFKWQLANVGFYDNSSIEYVGYDSRYNPFAGFLPQTGTPLGDFDDFFSMPMDLSGFGAGACNLNYYYSGASRSGSTYNQNDTLEIDYSADHGVTWVQLTRLGKAYLDNRGAVSNAYSPSDISDWAPMSIPLPTAAKTGYTVFRFRYYPSVSLGFDGGIDIGDGSFSSGNNFYLDRINFSAIPATVNTVMKGNLDVAVVPNPTSGDAYVVIRDADNTNAKIVVTDITGKTVYTVVQQLSGKETNIEIPHSVIAVNGIYLVQTVTGHQVNTQKLVVY